MTPDAAGRHEQRIGEAGAECGGGLDAQDQRGAGPAAGAHRRAEDDDDRVGAQVRRTFQKITKPSGTPVMSLRNAVGSCANPSG